MMHSIIGIGRWGLAGSLAVLLLVACGCATTTEDPRKFVGSWEEVIKEGAVFKTVLELRPDGSGLRTNLPDPHGEELAWYLKRDKLVLAPKDGSKPTFCDYRFDGADKLVLIVGANETALKRKPADK
jgi:hypothetical protein